MPLYLVTVKVPKSPGHDPRNKVTGTCPVTEEECTDVTGEHHTLIVHAPTVQDADDFSRARYGHVTRIEACNTPGRDYGDQFSD